jgi:hypothetical protein
LSLNEPAEQQHFEKKKKIENCDINKVVYNIDGDGRRFASTNARLFALITTPGGEVKKISKTNGRSTDRSIDWLLLG